MKVKKFQATTMANAMQQIKQELGSDAIILQNKAIKKGGFLGLFQKQHVEVIAALDKDVQQNAIQETVNKPSALAPVKEKDSNQSVLNEIKQLKKLISTQQQTRNQQFPAAYEYAFQYLLSQEVEETLAQRWVQEVHDNETSTDVSIDQMKQHIAKKMNQEIELVQSSYDTNTKKIIQFVGPTGVGKTTTLAKVAASYLLEEGSKIAFITLDTYRIAAVEQLKTYATILNVPIEVAYSLEDYQKALQKFAEYDRIFIDTAGRNYREPKFMKDLQQITAIERENVSTYLVLSLTAKQQDVLDIYDQFKAVQIQKMIFTKMDETLTYGNIINIIIQEQMPVAYITNGQDVPDDVMKPSSSFLTRQVLRDYDDA